MLQQKVSTTRMQEDLHGGRALNIFSDGKTDPIDYNGLTGGAVFAKAGMNSGLAANNKHTPV